MNKSYALIYPTAFYSRKRSVGRFATKGSKNELKKKGWILVIVLAVALCFDATEARSETPDCFDIGYTDASERLVRVAEKVKSAMISSGICVNMIGFPSKRGTLEFKHGKLDGYSLRISNWAKINDVQGIMVPTPLYSSFGYLVSHEKLSNPLSALTKRRIGVIRGSAWSDKLVIKSQNIVELSDTAHLVRFFLSGRCEGILMGGAFFEQGSHELISKHLYKVSETKFHLWLHPRHAVHMDEFNGAIIKWKSEGNSFDPSEEIKGSDL